MGYGIFLNWTGPLVIPAHSLEELIMIGFLGPDSGKIVGCGV